MRQAFTKIEDQIDCTWSPPKKKALCGVVSHGPPFFCAVSNGPPFPFPPSMRQLHSNHSIWAHCAWAYGPCPREDRLRFCCCACPDVYMCYPPARRTPGAPRRACRWTGPAHTRFRFVRAHAVGAAVRAGEATEQSSWRSVTRT